MLKDLLLLPNTLTLLRIALTPLFALSLYCGYPARMYTLAIFTIAALSDFYDGYFARKFKQQTPQGAFLDPLADKALVITAFSMFALQGIVDWWVVALIIARDIITTSIRLLLISSGTSLATSSAGKWKTALQFTIIYLVLFLLAFSKPAADIPHAWRVVSLLVYCMAALTAYSGIMYLFDMFITLKIIRKEA